MELRHLGGALASPAPGAGALAHLDAGFAMFAVGIATGPDALTRHLPRVTQSLAAWGGRRAYLNFAESGRGSDSFYDELTYRRLRDLRRRVDPHGLFRANHEIPV